MDEIAEGTESARVQAKWDGGPNALALVVVLAALGVCWRQVRDLTAWWWDQLDHGIYDFAPGKLLIFGLGMFVGVVFVLLAMVALERIFRAIREIGRR